MATGRNKREKGNTGWLQICFDLPVHCSYPRGPSWCLVKIFIAGLSGVTPFAMGDMMILQFGFHLKLMESKKT